MKRTILWARVLWPLPSLWIGGYVDGEIVPPIHGQWWAFPYAFTLIIFGAITIASAVHAITKLIDSQCSPSS